MTLAEIAPRLARARDRLRREHQDDVLRLERLVAHRELQLARAMAACGRAKGARARRSAGDYLVRRQRKLDVAQAALERARRRRRDVDTAR